MFKLSNIELNIVLRSKIFTANNLSSKRRYNPYAFTEQGIYMLMTMLRRDRLSSEIYKGEFNQWKN